ncbi:MAG: patatin-like phospholipase family protein, partial [Acidimicrobiia bacterium]
PLSDHAEALVARLPAGAWDSGELADPALPLPAAVPTALRGLLRWPPRPGLTVAGALPRGRRSASPMQRRHEAVHDSWPDAALWVCAVRLRDGRRVVFGRDDHPPLGVGEAVAASSAIPGVFSPVGVGGEDYVDGGVWSMTNADLTRGLGYDAIVVSAPLAGPEDWRNMGRRPSPGAAYRAYHLAVLAAETRRIRDAGTPVLALRPTPADAAAFRTGGGGVDRPSVAEQAYRSVTERLEADPALLAQLVEPVAVHP